MHRPARFLPARPVFQDSSIIRCSGRTELHVLKPDEHKYYIQVSHGCADHCAYCGDKKIVGELVSKPLQQCIAEAMRGIAKGSMKSN